MDVGMDRQKGAGPPEEDGLGLFDPKIDYAFKQIFGQNTPECKQVLLHLLNSAFARKCSARIRSIEYVNPYLDKKYAGDKLSIMDVRAITESGDHLDVEMQIGDSPHFVSRCMWYWASMYERQLAEADGYGKLRRCVVVSVTGFRPAALQSSGDYHSVFEVKERFSGLKLTDHLEIHFIELPKAAGMEDAVYVDDLAKWSIFLNGAADNSKRAVIDRLRKEVPEIDMAEQILARVSQDRLQRERYEDRRRFLIEQNTWNDEFRRQRAEVERAEAEVERAEAEVERAKAEVERAEAEAGQAKAEVERAEAEAGQAKADAERAEAKTKQITAMLIEALHSSGESCESISNKTGATEEFVREILRLGGR
jgi:predicted transposase/invertase (TIGR01784 family)